MQKYTEALTLCPNWSGIAAMIHLLLSKQLTQKHDKSAEVHFLL